MAAAQLDDQTEPPESLVEIIDALQRLPDETELTPRPGGIELGHMGLAVLCLRATRFLRDTTFLLLVGEREDTPGLTTVVLRIGREVTSLVDGCPVDRLAAPRRGTGASGGQMTLLIPNYVASAGAIYDDDSYATARVIDGLWTPPVREDPFPRTVVWFDKNDQVIGHVGPDDPAGTK